jgi:hypothetical protein
MTQKIKAQMKFNADNSIVGTFLLPDKTITNFYVDNCGDFKQWGNTEENEKKTIDELVRLIETFIYSDL